jgi:hypothetical protein
MKLLSTMTKGGGATNKVAPTTVPESFHLAGKCKDSIAVQTSSKHNYVNDDELHEEHPHLQDFLKPHHTVHLEVVAQRTVEKDKEEEKEDDQHEETTKNEFLESIPCPHATQQIRLEPQEQRPSLPRPAKSILHDWDCPSRKPCEETESKRSLSFGTVTLREYGT